MAPPDLGRLQSRLAILYRHPERSEGSKVPAQADRFAAGHFEFFASLRITRPVGGLAIVLPPDLGIMDIGDVLSHHICRLPRGLKGMARSDAETVEEYLAELPPDRRQAIAALREVVLENLPAGYVETMYFGMIGYVIPLERYPVTYNKQPLGYVALASQKNYMSLYLMNVYADPETEQWFKDEFRARGKRLNMGKSCVRFKSLDDLPVDLIGRVVALTSVEDYIGTYEAARGMTGRS